MSDDIPNQAGFWLPPDFLSDEEDDDDNILINNTNTLFPNSVSVNRIPFYYRSPEMVTEYENDFLASSSSYFSGGRFAAALASEPRMLSVSPQSTLTEFGSLKSRNGSSNATFQAPFPPTWPLGENDYWNLIYAQPPLPPLPPPSAVNHSLTGLCSIYKGQVLKHHSSPTWGTPMTEVCQQQKIMVHNREGERVIGLGGFMTETGGRCDWISAWPPLQQQRPNPLLWHGGSGMGGVLPGVFQMTRECAGTGVFLPRPYRKPITNSSRKKKADGRGRRKVVVVQQLRNHHKKMPSLQGEEDVARLPHEWTY